MSEAPAPEHPGLASAERLFAAGDYAGAGKAFRELAHDPSLTPEQRAAAENRLRTLRPDGVALAFGVITAAIVIIVYLLSRLGHA